MKKLVLSLFFGASIASMNAQIITNGDFEQPATPLLPGVVTDCPGWGLGFYTMETSSPYQGSQSAKLITIVDAATAAAIQWPTDTLAGIMQQEYTSAIANAGNLTLNFAYKHSVAAGDSAIVICQIADTMGAGPNDDVLLYQAYGVYTGNANAWQTASIPMTPIPGSMGNANYAIVLATSSIGAAFGTNPGTPNSTLWLDNVSLTGGANVIELTASVNVYPNPTNGALTFDASEAISGVEIYGMDGKLAMSATTTNVDISNLPNGIYHYSVMTVSGKVLKGKVSKI
ncbi:MAG: T9SS type A sorting domain-containing protein [Flavobacteriales bacterium]